MLKRHLTKIIRFVNILLVKNNLPKQIIRYFHETDETEVSAIEDIILFFQNLVLRINKLSFLEEENN